MLFNLQEQQMIDVFLRNGGDVQEVIDLTMERLQEAGFDVVPG